MDRLDYEVIRDSYLKVADDKAPIRELIGAADARIDYAEARTKLASRLLDRVKIQGGCGSWTDEERDAWASSYMDFLIGAIAIERDFEIQRLDRAAKFWAKQVALELNRNNELQMRLKRVRELVEEMPSGLSKVRAIVAVLDEGPALLAKHPEQP